MWERRREGGGSEGWGGGGGGKAPVVLAGVNWSATLANEIAGPSDDATMDPLCAHQLPTFAMFALLATDNVFDLVSDYATPYDTARGTYLSAVQPLQGRS